MGERLGRNDTLSAPAVTWIANPSDFSMLIMLGRMDGFLICNLNYDFVQTQTRQLDSIQYIDH